MADAAGRGRIRVAAPYITGRTGRLPLPRACAAEESLSEGGGTSKGDLWAVVLGGPALLRPDCRTEIALLWRRPTPHHVFGDRRLGNLEAEHQQFAMDPHCG